MIPVLLFRAVGIVIGLFITPIAVFICFKLGKPKLPKLLWLWDNMHEGYHMKGPDCKDPRVGKGVNKHWHAYKAKGYSDLKASIVWSTIRNPFRNSVYTRFCTIDLKKDFKVLFEYCTLSAFDGNKFDENSWKVSHYAAPHPWRLRDVRDSKGKRIERYVDMVLLRQGLVLHPMIRIITLDHDKHEPTHSEYILGYKTYRYMWFFAKSNRLHMLPMLCMRTASINYAGNRTDDEWA